MGAHVSDALRTFLQQRLTSMDQIEVALLLMKEPARSWSAPEVAAELGTAPEAAAMRLFLLASGGLISFEVAGVPRYRYVVADDEQDALMRELAEVYAADRDAVLSIVDSTAADPIHSFADAFKLRK